MLYRISKKFGSRREKKMINNIRAKAYKKRCKDSSSSSRDESDSDYSLSSNSEWVEHIRPVGRKEINILDPIVTGNIKTNKYPLLPFTPHPKTAILFNGVLVILPFCKRINQPFIFPPRWIYTTTSNNKTHQKVIIPIHYHPPQRSLHFNYKIEDHYIIHNNACILKYFIVLFFLCHFLFWKHSVSLCISSIFNFWIFERFTF